MTDEQYSKAFIHIGAMEEASKKLPTASSTIACMWLGPVFMTASILGAVAADRYAGSKYDEAVEALGGRDHLYSLCSEETDFGRKGNLKACYDVMFAPAKAARDAALPVPALASMGVGFLGLGIFFAGIVKTRREDKKREKLTEDILQPRLRAWEKSRHIS